jgi:hypothetical protein
MSVTFPLGVADFFGQIFQAEAQFRLGGNLTLSETAGGEVLAAARGVRLWSGSVTLTPARAIPFEAMQAKLDVLGQPGATFLVEHPYMRFPQADPQGAALDAATPSVWALNANAHIFSVGGLPAGYAITAGDHLSIAFGAGGSKRSYHRVLAGASVVSGVAGSIYVNPALPSGVIVGDDVQLLRPALKARVVPGSWAAPTLTPGGIVQASSFDWVQTLG